MINIVEEIKEGVAKYFAIKSNGEKCKSKEYFCISCKLCFAEYRTTIANEKGKKFKWTCQRCATSKMWEDKEYRQNHVDAIVKAKSTKESKKRHSLSMLKRFSDPEWKKKMLKTLYEARFTEEIKAKFLETYRQNAKNGLHNKRFSNLKKHHYTKEDKKINFKSSWELRFAIFLDKKKYNWEYEKHPVELKTYCNKILIPDFYIKELDLVVEIKGYFWKDAKEKWESFCKEYPQIKKCILFKEDLNKLETGEKKLEDYI